jgi:hypothetical protein
MKLTDFELLQPVEWDGIKGYISFICEDYLTICFIDEPLPTSANSRWGRHYVSILVYPDHYHEIRCRLDETKQEGKLPPTSDILQFGRCRSVGRAHKQNSTRKNKRNPPVQ